MPGGHTGNHNVNHPQAQVPHIDPVQQLLVAEKKAAETVAEARKRKTRRIKQAKEEAEIEIAKYRAERQKRFEEFEAQYLGTADDVTAQIEKDAENYLVKIEELIAINHDKVIDELIDLVVNITPKPHPNFFILKAHRDI